MTSDTASVAASKVEHHTRTYAAEHREALERDHWGRFALMHAGDVIGVFDNATAAHDAGREQFGSGNFAFVGIGALSTGYRVVTSVA